jgi:uncharacterized protein YndB with AHSA1/START domain
MSDTKPIVIERDIAAPVERVWRALTDIDDLKQWCPFFTDFQAVTGFHTEFMLGPDADHQYLHHVTVLEAIPNQKLVYSWDYGGMSPHSTVGFTLQDLKTHTHVVLTCVIDPLPTEPDDFMAGSSKGWIFTIDGLKKQVEN